MVVKNEFSGSCLKQNKVIFIPNNVVTLFIVYELGRCSQDLNAIVTLTDCLSGNDKLTKKANPNKYSYSKYGIRFYISFYSIPNFDWNKNVIIFGVCMSSSVHANNKNKDVLILGKRETKGLENTTLTTETEYSTNF